MSREIKFRAYIKKLHRYAKGIETILYHKECDIEGEGIWSVVSVATKQSIFECDEIIVEQYTGLKDKDDKEIYEGDIVKARWYRAKNARLDAKGEVKFDEGWFYIKCDPDGQDRLGVPIHNCYNLEVIGNIHENPELLGGEE